MQVIHVSGPATMCRRFLLIYFLNFNLSRASKTVPQLFTKNLVIIKPKCTQKAEEFIDVLFRMLKKNSSKGIVHLCGHTMTGLVI